MKTRLFSMLWGEKHIGWFERACVASLMQPNNIAAIRKHCGAWDIVTRAQDMDRIHEIVSGAGIEIAMRPISVMDEVPAILQRELIEEMRRCVEMDCAAFIAPPDTMFGDKSLTNIFAYAQERNVCVAVPHVRVTPGIFDEDNPASSNARLVAASWKNLHRTWIESNSDRELTNSYSGGVSWRKLSDDLYGVTHLLPTVYLARPVLSDVEWMEAYQLNGVWDHSWPSKLVAENRQRVIGSSDAAFIAEVTPEFGNIPPCTSKDPKEIDRYFGKAAHNIFNKNMIAIFRAEPSHA